MTKPQDTATTVADPKSEPYDFDRCTVSINIQLLATIESESDANGKTRKAIVSISTHGSTPIIKLTQFHQMQDSILELMDEIRAEMPKREQAEAKAEAEKKQKEEARSKKTTAPTTERDVQKAKAKPKAKEPKKPAKARKVTILNLD